MPIVTEKGGLELLLMAWNDYDVAVYHARWYSLLAQIFQGILLVLSVSIIVFTVLYTQRCDNEDDANFDPFANIELFDGNADLFANHCKCDNSG